MMYGMKTQPSMVYAVDLNPTIHSSSEDLKDFIEGQNKILSSINDIQMKKGNDKTVNKILDMAEELDRENKRLNPITDLNKANEDGSYNE